MRCKRSTGHYDCVGRLAVLLAVTLSGCAADRALHVRIGDEIARPARAVVVFLVDGFGARQFDEALTEGRLPHIRRHILDRGVRVETAVACIPTITYANCVTCLTGLFPGHHGILSNKWCEPSTGRFQNYCFIKTYQQVDDDYRGVPTLYELMPDRLTVSIQAAMRRGVTHTIDNWATSGVNWFFDNVTGVDCLVAQRFELIAAHTRRWGRWPDLIWAYFPGPDNLGHRFGPGSIQYRKAIDNVDVQIGRICEALDDVGMYDRTVLCLVSDHGMVPVGKENVLDIAALIRERTGARVWLNEPTPALVADGPLAGYDYAVAVSASRWAAVYPLPGRRGAEMDGITALARSLEEHEISATGDAAAPSRRPEPVALPPWLREAVAHPAVELAACCFRPGAVHLFSRDTHALVIRTREPEERHRVWPLAGPHRFAPHELPAATTDLSGTDSRVWLWASARSKYPDLIPQIVAMFDNERAGNIVFFAAEGWDFSRDDPAGGHGSILSDEMHVPMLFAGPGVPPGSAVPPARTCDLMPTLLHLLGAEPALPDGARVDMDGINLLP